MIAIGEQGQREAEPVNKEDPVRQLVRLGGGRGGGGNPLSLKWSSTGKMCLGECLVAGLQRNNRTSLVPLLNRLLRDFQNFVLFTLFYWAVYSETS